MNKLSNIDLSRFSGYRCGGNARHFIEVETKEELACTVDELEESKSEWHIIGKGFNTLISDSGFNGTVLMLSGNFCNVYRRFQENMVVSGPAVTLPKLLRFIVEQQFTGLEFLGGVPGSVGGAVLGNCGTATDAIGDYIKEIEVYCPEEQSYTRIKKEDIGFKYRGTELPERNILTEAVFDLKTGIKTDIIEKIRQNIVLKRATQPVREKSCGCVFKNPDNGKTSAGRLIEMAGFKGIEEGGARISDSHANYIINSGGATSADIWNLIKKVRISVREKFGVDMKLEIRLLGEGFDE
ncbi:MAG: UDP-N-acetylmuramate dehydrogenase [Elusimicrobiota bacterium]